MKAQKEITEGPKPVQGIPDPSTATSIQSNLLVLTIFPLLNIIEPPPDHDTEIKHHGSPGKDSLGNFLDKIDELGVAGC